MLKSVDWKTVAAVAVLMFGAKQFLATSNPIRQKITG